jgi:hypothetical protein
MAHIQDAPADILLLSMISASAIRRLPVRRVAAQPHARSAEKFDASFGERAFDLFNAAHSGVLSRLKAIDGIRPNARTSREALCAPI